MLWQLLLPSVASAQTDPNQVTISAQGRLQVLEVWVKQGDNVVAGDVLAVMKQADGGKLTLRAGASGVLREWKPYRTSTSRTRNHWGCWKSNPCSSILETLPLPLPRNQRSVAC